MKTKMTKEPSGARRAKTTMAPPSPAPKPRTTNTDSTRPRQGTEFARSPCAIACTLDLLGDKWTLLVVRDLMRGKTTYNDLLNSPEGIQTTTLAERLRRLEEGGVISRSAYQERPVRYAYTLTEKGRQLGDVLSAVVRWGRKHIPGTKVLQGMQPELERKASRSS